jgi:hypothetical protein
MVKEHGKNHCWHPLNYEPISQALSIQRQRERAPVNMSIETHEYRTSEADKAATTSLSAWLGKKSCSSAKIISIRNRRSDRDAGRTRGERPSRMICNGTPNLIRCCCTHHNCTARCCKPTLASGARADEGHTLERAAWTLDRDIRHKGTWHQRAKARPRCGHSLFRQQPERETPRS